MNNLSQLSAISSQSVSNASDDSLYVSDTHHHSPLFSSWRVFINESDDFKNKCDKFIHLINLQRVPRNRKLCNRFVLQIKILKSKFLINYWYLLSKGDMRNKHIEMHRNFILAVKFYQKLIKSFSTLSYQQINIFVKHEKLSLLFLSNQERELKPLKKELLVYYENLLLLHLKHKIFFQDDNYFMEIMTAISKHSDQNLRVWQQYKFMSTFVFN